ncbi:MAG TPA: DUF6178 family protein [Pseudomonadales bacterium]|nr:DUF6178 family protein [Pseudomonadales bacterium]
MQKRSAPKSRSSKNLASRPKHLLKTLTDSPALPAFVRTLPTPVLHTLIERVGLHDAGELIALTTTDQMRGLFEVALWDSLRPGDAEQLRPEKFVDWLEVMTDVSPRFAAERLIELGETFVAVNLAPLLRIIDKEVTVEHSEDGQCACVVCELSARDVPFAVFDEYIVACQHEDEWDVVNTVLAEIDGEDRDFLNRVLTRCSPKPTARGFVDTVDALVEDETHERRERRERGGYITPPLAAAFLEDARTLSRDALAAATDYDDVTRRYFEQIAAAAASAEAERKRAIAESSDDDGADVPRASPLQMRALEAALVEAEIVGDRQPLLLQGPQSEHRVGLELKDRLDRLRFTRPDAFAARLGELAYLANVLMVGAVADGKRFDEAAAAQVALACANLGLDHLLGRDLDPLDRADMADALLERPPGVVRLFQLGWQLIQALPLRCATALISTLRSDHVRERLARKRWILAEIDSALSQPDILKLIEAGEFEDVGDNLVLLSLVLDARACQCLKTLIADVPRYPIQIELGFRRAERTTAEQRYFTRVDQLERVGGLLDDLEHLLKT